MGKPKRKRITKQIEDMEVVYDDESYTSNSCSNNAKKHSVFFENIEIEFWIDKHYSYRDLEREGIGIDFVKELVEKAFKHILYYSTKHNFVFLNHPPKKIKGYRLVLQQEFAKKEMLNVTVEYHFYKLKTFEVTVITAICKNDYYLFDGQYAIRFQEDGGSKLFFNENKITNEIDDYIE